jgi:hypothetical protein
MEYFRKTGAMGGKACAGKHAGGELSGQGRMGGRSKERHETGQERRQVMTVYKQRKRKN